MGGELVDEKVIRAERVQEMQVATHWIFLPGPERGVEAAVLVLELDDLLGGDDGGVRFGAVR